jgi:hypothetical protein
MRPNRWPEAGFTLVEALVATAIIVSVTAAVLSTLDPARGISRTQPELADMQQRFRIGIDALTRDLVNAGAGAYSGAGAGSLVGFFAPILPFRRGLDSALDGGVGVVTRDAITILYVPSTASQTAIKLDMSSPASQIVIEAESGCPTDPRTALIDPLCGFTSSVTKAVVFDGTGSFDLIDIASADAAAQTLDFQPGASKTYLGSASNHLTRIVEVSSHVYYLNTTTRQLMHYDGFSTVTPVLDNVVGLDFEYFGEASPPALIRPGEDQTVSYGPSPPPPGVTQPPFAPGENCTWLMSGGGQVTRLAILGSGGSALVKLTASELTDGPWCPDDGNANRYDADLFRIRMVRVTLRVQSGNDSVRGSLATGNDAMFVHSGTALLRAYTVPDQSVRFDVSPRNLNLHR